MRQGIGAMPPRSAENVIMAIVSGVPEPAAAALSLLDHAASLYSAAGLTPPAWIAGLQRKFAPQRAREER